MAESTSPAQPTPSAEVDHGITVSAPKAGRARPLVAIIADNQGSETTDLIIPFGIFKESNAADVLVVSAAPGVVKLIPALQLQPDLTTAEFDKTNPAGADIVVVPAMDNSKNPVVIDWVREQAKKGAMVVSICEGARVAARAGVFDGKNAATHWFDFDKMVKAYPKTTWLHDRRYVVDGNVMSTTGITASIPAILALVEAMAGRDTARATADSLGAEDWDAAYDSKPFRLTANRVLRIVGNTVAFWGHDTIEIPVEDGFDEINLALVADSWTRTYCSQAVTASGLASIRSRHGLVLVPDGQAKPGRTVIKLEASPAMKTLDQTLSQISQRYGQGTADIVALQLEYPTGK